MTKLEIVDIFLVTQPLPIAIIMKKASLNPEQKDLSAKPKQDRTGRDQYIANKNHPFDQVIWDDIISKVASGQTLSAILKDNVGYPHHAAFYSWFRDNKELTAAYDKALEEQTSAMVDKFIVQNDNVDGQSLSQIAKARLQMQGLQWYATRVNRRKFGDKTETVLTGANGDALFNSDLGKLSDEQLKDIQTILTKAKE